MNELIKIEEKDGKQAVSARELYEKLGFNKAHWAKWYKKNIVANDYAILNEDYAPFTLSVNGNETQDFVISIDFAKKISMLARTEAGEKIRAYFIEVEKKYKKEMKVLTPAEMFFEQAKMALEQEKKITAIEEKQTEIINKFKVIEDKINENPGYVAVLGYCNIKGIKLPNERLLKLGKQAAEICRDEGYEIGKTNHSHFGYVNTYPESVLDRVFEMNFGKTLF
jgi:anti-repressor protein